MTTAKDVLTAHMAKLGRVPVAEAARRAMVAPMTIRAWIEDGRIKGIRYARLWWVDVRSLEKVTADLNPRAS